MTDEISTDEIKESFEILAELVKKGGLTIDVLNKALSPLGVGLKSTVEQFDSVVKGVKHYQDVAAKEAKNRSVDLTNQASKFKAGLITQTEFNRSLEKMNATLAHVTDADTKSALTKAANEASLAVNGTKASQAVNSAAKGVATGLGMVTAGAAKAFSSLAHAALGSGDAFSTTGALLSIGVDTVNTAAQAISKGVGAAATDIPVLGAAAAGAAVALSVVAQGLADLAKAGISMMVREAGKFVTEFQQMSAVGAVYEGGLKNMISTAISAGMTLDQFSKVVVSNKEAITDMGLGVTEGSKRLSKAMHDAGTPFRDSLFALGMTMEDQGAMFAQTMSIMAGPGKQLQASNAEVAAQTMDYAKNLKIISGITGEDIKSKQEAIRKEGDTLFMNQKIAAMEPKEREKFQAMLLTMNADQRRALTEKMKYGTIVSQDLAVSAATNSGIAKLYDDQYKAAVIDKKGGATGIALQKKHRDEIAAQAKLQTALGLSTSESVVAAAKVINDAWQGSAAYTDKAVAAQIKAVEAQLAAGKTGGKKGNEVSLMSDQQKLLLETQKIAAASLGKFTEAVDFSITALTKMVDAIDKFLHPTSTDPDIMHKAKVQVEVNNMSAAEILRINKNRTEMNQKAKKEYLKFSRATTAPPPVDLPMLERTRDKVSAKDTNAAGKIKAVEKTTPTVPANAVVEKPTVTNMTQPFKPQNKPIVQDPGKSSGTEAGVGAEKHKAADEAKKDKGAHTPAADTHLEVLTRIADGIDKQNNISKDSNNLHKKTLELTR